MAGHVDYTTIPDGTALSFSLGGTTVTGSANVVSAYYAGYRGLGIRGGGSDMSLDLGETMTIDYHELVTSVTLDVVDIDPPGNVRYSFEAFNGSESLGVFAIPPHLVGAETKDLSALDGYEPFTKITLSLSVAPPLGLQIQGTAFTAVPEPPSLVSAGLGLVGLALAVCWRRGLLAHRANASGR
jgi:hypothetical protein